MPSPIIENMLKNNDLPFVTADNYADFITSAGSVVLFFCENPDRYPESNDVAMVLPEIIKEFPGMQGGIVDQAFERELQSQFDFTRWPALAFFADGQYRGNMTGIQNWDDYLEQIPTFLKNNTSAIPAINL
jgi:hydrogenase-1 operon protein HyaE